MNNSITETNLIDSKDLTVDKISLIETDSVFVNFTIEGYEGSFIIWNTAPKYDLRVQVLDEIIPDWRNDENEDESQAIRTLTKEDYCKFISQNITRIEVEVE